MRWTMYYTMMSLCLVGTLGAIICVSADVKPQFAGLLGLEAAPKPMVIKSAGKTRHTIKQATPVVEVGSTRNEVIAALGEPQSITEGNTRWIYGTQALIFKDEQLVGSVSIDREQSVRMHETKLEQLGEASKARKPVKARQTVKSRTASQRRITSTKPTSWEPMFRRFYSDQPVPRGMRTTTGNRGLAKYRDQRFHNPRSIYSRN